MTKLDRLARSVRHLWEIVDELGGKVVALNALNLGLDTANATGKLVLNVVGSIAQFERAVMLEHQREAAELAEAEGKYKGRKESPHPKTD